MQFLFPSFLWALLALAIPVIIHLFYFRRFKKVYFTNVKYLKEIKEETSNKNKLKNLLVLLARCLALTALVLAFAQPFIPKDGNIKAGINHVSLFVDNSYSMTATKEDVPLLDYAKDKARAVIEAYSEEDWYQILTHDFEGRHQRFISKEDALAYVDEIQVSPAVQNLSEVLNRQKQLFETASGNKISYIISDFQKSISDYQSFQDTTMEINLLPVQTVQQKNVTLDSVWFDGPVPFINQNNKLIVRVKNNSNEDAEQVKLSLKKDGQVRPIGIRDIPASQYITDTVEVSVEKSGWQQCVISVMDYPVQFDDDYYIAFDVPDTIQALFINESGPNRFMDALFKGVKYFHLSNQNVNQLQYQQFQNFDLIILNDLNRITSGLNNELLQYLQNGGNVLVFPGENADIAAYNQFFTGTGANRIISVNNSRKEVSAINTEEFIFSDVFINTGKNLKLPVTSRSFDVSNASSGLQENLLTYRDGSAYLSKYRVGEGQIFICFAPLHESSNDLVYNAEIFVPLLYKMAISSSKQKKLAYTITNNIVVETENKRKIGDYVYRISGDKTELIPGLQTMGNKILLDINDQIRTSGYYDLKLDEAVVSKLAFNYDRKESDMRSFSETELEGINPSNTKIKILPATLQANISGAIQEKDKGIVLWKWFLIAALVFLLLESLLLRYFKI